MQLYIGTKQVLAVSMTLGAYNEYRGWESPDNGDEPGYLVEYTDGGKPNHLKHQGYISWSPKAQFDAAYRPTTGMSFGLALEALKLGKKVARHDWNGKDMWLMLIRGKDVQIHHPGFGPVNEHDHKWRSLVPSFLSWIGMKTADNKFVPWLASQTDMLSDSWYIVE